MFEASILCACMVQRRLRHICRLLNHITAGRPRWTVGRHGWIEVCGYVSYIDYLKKTSSESCWRSTISLGIRPTYDELDTRATIYGKIVKPTVWIHTCCQPYELICYHNVMNSYLFLTIWTHMLSQSHEFMPLVDRMNSYAITTVRIHTCCQSYELLGKMRNR